jgi:hypothetical protein
MLPKTTKEIRDNIFKDFCIRFAKFVIINLSIYEIEDIKNTGKFGRKIDGLYSKYIKMMP